MMTFSKQEQLIITLIGVPGLVLLLFVLPWVGTAYFGNRITQDVNRDDPLQRSNNYFIYTVQTGDNLYKIADEFGIDVQEILRANQLDNPDTLFAGQELNLPRTVSMGAIEASQLAYEFFNLRVHEAAADKALEAEILEAFPEALDGESLEVVEIQSVYIVEPGDSLNSIASKLNVSVYELVALNLESRPDKLMVGQELNIPVASASGDRPERAIEYGGISANSIIDGDIYRVQPGDTVIKVAERFGRKPGVIRAANNLIGDVLYTGERIIIPPHDYIILPGLHEPWWPVDPSLRLSSPYYPGHPGIDIVLATGTPVQAISDGYIESIGFDPDGYGIYIILRHSQSPSIKSLYAHLDEALVEKGQKVDRENIIGLAGNTGNSSSAHLHLEIIESGRRLNPCYYLKGGC